MIGRVAQLNRVSDYGSDGYRFESCRDHSLNIEITESFGRVAQLNRVSDYGSDGYRFESCRGHLGSLCLIKVKTLSFFRHHEGTESAHGNKYSCIFSLFRMLLFTKRKGFI